MKLRLKKAHSVTATTTGPVPSDQYVVAINPDDWEPIPEERWEDVTGECGITRENYIAHGETSHPLTLGNRLIQTREDYRLVKRSLWECLPEVARELIEREFKYCSWMTTLHNTDVLKVERKVSV